MITMVLSCGLPFGGSNKVGSRHDIIRHLENVFIPLPSRTNISPHSLS